MNIMSAALIFAIRLYRWILSPAKMAFFGPNARCRFAPSCSEFALAAIQIHGPLEGASLAVRRICRCHPWGDCGYDPVPPRKPGRPVKAARGIAGTPERLHARSPLKSVSGSAA